MEATLTTPGEVFLQEGAAPRLRAATEDRDWVRWSCIGVTIAFISLLLLVPLATIFAQALSKGFGVYLASLTDPYCWAAIKLTLLTAAIPYR